MDQEQRLERSDSSIPSTTIINKLPLVPSLIVGVDVRRNFSDVSLRDPLLGSETESSCASSSANGSPKTIATAFNLQAEGKEGLPVAERISEIPKADIGPEAKDYKAGWTDLLKVCAPDTHLIIFAFFNLTLAAIAQVYIPHFTGKILDALGADGGEDGIPEGDVWDVPGFSENVKVRLSEERRAA